MSGQDDVRHSDISGECCKEGGDAARQTGTWVLVLRVQEWCYFSVLVVV